MVDNELLATNKKLKRQVQNKHAEIKQLKQENERLRRFLNRNQTLVAEAQCQLAALENIGVEKIISFLDEVFNELTKTKEVERWYTQT